MTIENQFENYSKKLNAFVFREEMVPSNLIMKVLEKLFSVLFQNLAGHGGRRSPVIYVKDDPQKVYVGRNLNVLGEAIGLTDPLLQEQLSIHTKKLEIMSFIRFFLYAILSAVFIVLPFLLIPILFTSNAYNLVLYFFLILFLYMEIAAGLSYRISYSILVKYYVNTLCIQTIIYLIIELVRASSPLNFIQKKKLTKRIDYFSRACKMLSTYYRSSDHENQKWIRNHFFQIERYIRKRERWVIAPNNTTLQVLQQDFYQLAKIFVIENFGDFKWDANILCQNTQSTKKLNNNLKNLLKIIFGIFLPIVIIVIMITEPTSLNFINFDRNKVILLCVGWLLLAIDGFLELGIVSNVVNVAKNLKEFS